MLHTVDKFISFIYCLSQTTWSIEVRRTQNTNQPEIQTDTIKHRQTEVNTDSHTRKQERESKKRNYYKAKRKNSKVPIE